MANFPYRRHSRRRRELWRNKTGWVVRGVKCSKIFRRCSIDISPYRHARRKLISFERNWSWWWNVACYSLRVSRATALRCSRYADIRMSLFLFLFPSLSRRIFRSSSSTSIHSGEYYVWATSMDTCNSLVLVRTYPLKLLCAPWFNTRRHCLRLPCLFNLDELSSLVTDQMDFPFWFCVVLLLKRWMYCFFLFYFILFFYASFLVIFLAIFFDQKIEDWSNPVGGRGKPCGSEVYCAGSWMGLSRGERSGPRLRTRTRSPDSRTLRYYTGADSVGRLSNRPGTLYPCPWTVST